MAQQKEPIKICTGCKRLNTEQPLGLNKKGEPYLACCPDNNYKLITSVEWLIYKLTDEPEHYLFLCDKPEYMYKLNEIIEQAKAMEKEQIENAYYCGFFGHGVNGEPCVSGGKYYNDNYNK